MSDHPFPPRPPLAKPGSPVRWFDPELQAWLDAHVAYWNCYECAVLPKVAVNAMRTVGNWRRGHNAMSVTLPPGTPVASFMHRDGRPSDRWDGGEGLGISKNNTTHSGVLAGYLLDAHGAKIGLKMWELYPGCGRVRRRIILLDDERFGTKNARAFHAILEPDLTPLGGRDNPYLPIWQLLTDNDRQAQICKNQNNES